MSLKDKQVSCNSVEGNHPVKIDRVPDTCPICHHKGTPQEFGYRYISLDDGFRQVQSVLVCPNLDCQSFFIGYYDHVGQKGEQLYRYNNSKPMEIVEVDVQPEVAAISPTYEKVYRQAAKAELLGLDEIAGTGYRRAFEFLIKDYVKSLKKDDEERKKVETKFLGSCINEDVADQRIKDVASRATWLGNDETHYVRKWEEKDIGHLKTLIDLTVYWIKAEVLTREAMESMPEPKE